MASYFTLTLDITPPSGLIIQLNGGDEYTMSRTVTLTLSISDSSTTGYQIKIWGISGKPNEASASWESYTTIRNVALTDGDGTKTVYVKVRDDVGNETVTVSASIILDTHIPVITILGPDRSRVHPSPGYNTAAISFLVDVPFTEYKVCVVTSTAATQDLGIIIPTTSGSVNTSGSSGNYQANHEVQVIVNSLDLETVSPNEGVKIIKVFAKSRSGLWSVK